MNIDFALQRWNEAEQIIQSILEIPDPVRELPEELRRTYDRWNEAEQIIQSILEIPGPVREMPEELRRTHESRRGKVRAGNDTSTDFDGLEIITFIRAYEGIEHRVQEVIESIKDQRIQPEVIEWLLWIVASMDWSAPQPGYANFGVLAESLCDNAQCRRRLHDALEPVADTAQDTDARANFDKFRSRISWLADEVSSQDIDEPKPSNQLADSTPDQGLSHSILTNLKEQVLNQLGRTQMLAVLKFIEYLADFSTVTDAIVSDLGDTNDRAVFDGGQFEDILYRAMRADGWALLMLVEFAAPKRDLFERLFSSRGSDWRWARPEAARRVTRSLTFGDDTKVLGGSFPHPDKETGLKRRMHQWTARQEIISAVKKVYDDVVAHFPLEPAVDEPTEPAPNSSQKPSDQKVDQAPPVKGWKCPENTFIVLGKAQVWLRRDDKEVLLTIKSNSRARTLLQLVLDHDNDVITSDHINLEFPKKPDAKKVEAPSKIVKSVNLSLFKKLRPSLTDIPRDIFKSHDGKYTCRIPIIEGRYENL